MKRFFTIAVLLFGFIAAGGQTVIFVSPSGNDSNTGASWSSAKSTLPGALLAASGTTSIYMMVGTYSCPDIAIPNGVTVTGGFSSASTGTDISQRLYPGTNANWEYPSLCTILDGNNASRVATVHSGGKLEGCVITRGWVNDNGGGVMIDGGTVQHCVLIHNSALDETNLTAKGGGAYVQNNGSLLNCVIAYNYANNGPAVAGTNGTLTNNTITANYAVANCGILNDIDGNTYSTIVLGEQCWMRENLRTTRFSDGTAITLGGGSFTATSRRYYPSNGADNVATYGYLYNWYAVMNGAAASAANPSGVRGVCPTGWHIPSDAEWTQLTDFLQNHTAYQCNDAQTSIAKSLASNVGWSGTNTICFVGNQPASNNSTFFNAMPAGKAYVYQSVGSWYVNYNDFRNFAYFWSCTESGVNSFPWMRSINYNSDAVHTDYNGKDDGFSVRCIRD